MTDFYGAQPLPATDGVSVAKRGDHARDRALDAIAGYLKATLVSQLGSVWEAIAPSNELVAETFTIDPADALVNPAQLPALFVWRGPASFTREAEDYLTARTPVNIVWLLWWDGPLKRERFLPFQGQLMLAAHSLLTRGRHPSWVVAGDTTPGAATRGSVLVQQAGLVEPIREMRSQPLDVALDPGKTGTPVRYKALSLTVPIAERMARDPALFTVPSIDTANPDNANPGAGFPYPGAMGLTLTQQDTNPIEQLKPQP